LISTSIDKAAIDRAPSGNGKGAGEALVPTILRVPARISMNYTGAKRNQGLVRHESESDCEDAREGVRGKLEQYAINAARQAMWNLADSGGLVVNRPSQRYDLVINQISPDPILLCGRLRSGFKEKDVELALIALNERKKPDNAKLVFVVEDDDVEALRLDQSSIFIECDYQAAKGKHDDDSYLAYIGDFAADFTAKFVIFDRVGAQK